MVPRICVEEPANHALVLSAMLLGLAFEELNAALGQRDSDFDPFFTEHQLVWRREKVTDDPQAPEWLVGVSDFPSHRFACPSASNRLR